MKFWRFSEATLKQLWFNLSSTWRMWAWRPRSRKLSHMSATLQKMMSRLTVADDLKASSERSQVKEQFQEIIKVSKWSHHEKIKDYELTKSKRMLKTKEHKRSEGYPAKDDSSSYYQNQWRTLVTSLRGRLLGIQFIPNEVSVTNHM